MKVKLFWQSNPMVHLLFTGKSDKNARAIEDQINAWLSENSRIRIVDIRQSAYYTSLGTSPRLISAWYEEGTAKRLTTAARWYERDRLSLGITVKLDMGIAGKGNGATHHRGFPVVPGCF